MLNIGDINNVPTIEKRKVLLDANTTLSRMKAEHRIEWALENIEGPQVLTSSFGVQSAVCLHMYSIARNDTPVILLDTGYLFPETYQFIEELTNRLSLNLKVYSSNKSRAWQESVYGEIWNQGVEGLNRYNRINKVEPMARALSEFNVSVWHSGLRRQQSDSRKKLDILSTHNGVFKYLPIVDWHDLDIDSYLKKNNLPYHPLFYSGYASIGDVHTSMPVQEGTKAEDSRFFGLKRECGLHE